MRVLIIGAGVIGATTAYRLRQAGCEVEVFEGEGAAAQGASFANGGLLTPSMSDPWNAPGVWRDLLRWMGDPSAPMLLHARAIPSLARWGLEFLAASSPARFALNTQRNLRLAAFSLAGMARLRRDEELRYDAAALGTFKIFRDARAFEAARELHSRPADDAVAARALEPRELVQLEPALAPIEQRLAGALLFPGDEWGDAQQFTQQLCEAAQRNGVRFHFSTHVRRIMVRGGRVAGLALDRGEASADAVVVAAGCRTTALLRDCGVRAPIQPVKGYSLTCSTPSGESTLLTRPLVDDALHAAVTPLGARIRIAGTAEFSGFDAALPPARLENLRALLREILPEQALRLLPGAVPWTGMRPMSCDGVPCIGACGPRGLYVNSGHGHLGWTLADGSARLITSIVRGEPAPLDARDYSLERFA